MKISLSRKFATIFISELSKIFGEVNSQNWDDFSCMCICTYGWHEAFKNTCLKMNYNTLYKYYDSLSWERSDAFDWCIAYALSVYIK